MPERTMSYREVAPCDVLRDHVAAYCEFVVHEVPPDKHDHAIPVDGCTAIIYLQGSPLGPGCILVGPRMTSLRVPLYKGTVWAVRVQPGASRSILGMDGEDLFDVHVPMHTLAQELDGALHAAFSSTTVFEDAVHKVDEALTTWTASTDPLDEQVTQAVYKILRSKGEKKITEIAEEVSLSERQFLRRFGKEVGLTPKQYARVCRMRSAAIEAVRSEEKSWGEIAAELGFSDQAHMVHEFTDLFGMTPTEFDQVMTDRIEHGEIHIED